MNQNRIKFLDKYVGGFLVNLLSLFRGKPKDEFDKILVIMFWGIGSVINAMPVLRAVRKKYPKAKISVLAPAKAKALFFNCQYVDTTYFVDLSLKNVLKTVFGIYHKFDVAIDTEHWLTISALFAWFAAPRRIGFSNTSRARLYTDKIPFDPGEHAVVNNLKLAEILGAKVVPELVKIQLRDVDKEFVTEFIRTHKLRRPVFAIAPGSGATYKERRWPWHKYAELADALVDAHNARIVFIGAPDEKELIESVRRKMKHLSASAAGFSLGRSIVLLGKCDLFIGNDSGAVHMAAAQGVATIGIYGPETPVIFGPFGDNCVGIYKGLDCSPHIKVYEGKYEECKYDYKCLSLISVEEVLYYAERLLKENVKGMIVSCERTI